MRFKFYEFLLGIILLIIFIIMGVAKVSLCKVDVYEAELIELKNEYINLNEVLEEQREEIKEVKEIIKNQHKDLGEFDISFYDLSVQSCGKSPTHKAYGISRSGFNLRGHTWETARAVAVDPNIIPLNSNIYIQFNDDRYKMFTGVYKAVDTGSAIKSKKIDLFIGENETRYCMDLGLTKAQVILLGEGI